MIKTMILFINFHYTININEFLERDLYIYFGLLPNKNSTESRNLNIQYTILFKAKDIDDAVEYIYHKSVRKNNCCYTHLDNENAVELLLIFWN